MHLAENMIGWQKRLGEYPTNLTQTKVLLQCSLKDCFRAGDRGTLYEAFQLLRVRPSVEELPHEEPQSQHRLGPEPLRDSASQEMASVVRSSAQANLIGCACAAQRGAR